jgi:hypothetical protein
MAPTGLALGRAGDAGLVSVLRRLLCSRPRASYALHRADSRQPDRNSARRFFQRRFSAFLWQ